MEDLKISGPDPLQPFLKFVPEYLKNICIHNSSAQFVERFQEAGHGPIDVPLRQAKRSHVVFKPDVGLATTTHDYVAHLPEKSAPETRGAGIRCRSCADRC
jgi:hypothetical protein